MKLNKKSEARTLNKRTIVAALFAATFLITHSAAAADGDNLVSFDAAVTAGIPACSVGTGLAYDGTNLILSCWGSNVLERVNAATHLNAGAVTISGLPFGADLQALAWDATRGRLWACNAHVNVVLINVGAGAVDGSQPTFPVAGCTDGLAYDASDDTLWVSPDADPTTYHYSTAGVLLASFSNSGLLGSCGNSGIAVGGPNLYLANNGCSEIYTVNKTFTSSTLFASFPARLEDLECDGRTFAPKGAIWSQDAYDRTLNAWEIAPGLCAFGGIASCGDGNVDAGEECDDGNLANGDGCDANCQLESTCGDGNLEPDEECDDGNLTNGDGCTDLCEIEGVCGNNVVEANEQCDDGNLVDGDGCSAQCTLEGATCGDGIVEGEEVCDPPGPEDCNNHIDDDDDGRVDCADSDCADPNNPDVGIQTCGRGCTFDAACARIIRDPARIVWGTSSGRDVITLHGRFALTSAVAPSSETLAVRLSNAAGTIYRATLLPGDLQGSGRRFRYRDQAAQNGPGNRGGLYSATVRTRQIGGVEYLTFRLAAVGDLSAATQALMTAEITLGNDVGSLEAEWTATKGGWTLHQRNY